MVATTTNLERQRVHDVRGLSALKPRPPRVPYFGLGGSVLLDRVPWLAHEVRQRPLLESDGGHGVAAVKSRIQF